MFRTGTPTPILLINNILLIKTTTTQRTTNTPTVDLRGERDA